MSMTKQEIIKVIANSAEITLKAAEKAVNTLTDLLVDEVKTEDRFLLAGVGVFTRVDPGGEGRSEPPDRRTHPDPREESREVPPGCQLQGEAEQLATQHYPPGLGRIASQKHPYASPGGV